MSARIEQQQQSLHRQYCPVCGKLLFETEGGASGNVIILCRRCEKFRTIKLKVSDDETFNG
jgi:hypothetical protein